MKFGDLNALFLLLGSLALGIVSWWGIRRKRAALARFGELALILRDRAEVSFAWQGGKSALVVLGSIFIVLACARLQCGTHLELLKREGVDIIVAVDCSKSMLAEDFKPNRMTKAVQDVRGILDSLDGDRIGLVAFAGEAFLQCPLTLDYSAASIFLSSFNTDLISTPGTSVGDAIRVAAKAFESAERKYKALILITDGEDLAGDPMGAATEAREQGIKIYPIGVGSLQGTPIPEFDANGQRVGFKKDENDEIVVSRLEEPTLQKIALETGGKYHRASSGELEIAKVLGEINKLEKKELEGKLMTQYEDRYQWPLLLGVIILIVEFLLPESPRCKRKKAATLTPTTGNLGS